MGTTITQLGFQNCGKGSAYLDAARRLLIVKDLKLVGLVNRWGDSQNNLWYGEIGRRKSSTVALEETRIGSNPIATIVV